MIKSKSAILILNCQCLKGSRVAVSTVKRKEMAASNLIDKGTQLEKCLHPQTSLASVTNLHSSDRLPLSIALHVGIVLQRMDLTKLLKLYAQVVKSFFVSLTVPVTKLLRKSNNIQKKTWLHHYRNIIKSHEVKAYISWHPIHNQEIIHH